MARISHYEDHRREVLRLVFQAQVAHGRAPSIRYLAKHCQVGVATMHSYLTKMHEEGLVEWRAGKHRSLKTTDEGRRALS